MIKRNLIANYLGQGWVALMGLAFVPLYIKYLGIEAYALIGLFAMLQAWLSILDIGMTPTLGREMARFTGGSHSAQSIRDLLRSIEFIAFSIAVLIAVVVAFGAEWIANNWLQVQALPNEVVAEAFVVMGLVLALRFVEGIYRSSIIGLQRQVLFNAINSALATMRGLGSVAILVWVSPTIQAFFLWQAILSIVTLVILAFITYSTLPTVRYTAKFSIIELRGVWRFAGGVFGITFLALLLTQIDKVLLSKLLTLSDYGYYTLAATVAGALFMLISPITQAWYPRFCELHARDEEDVFAEAYHKSAQLVSVFAGSAAVVLIMFAETFLKIWTQDLELSERVAPLLRLLMLGNLLNGLMWVPYQAQLAYGWTSLSIRANIAAVAIIVPAILWVTPRYGMEGAAWVWVGLNTGYFLLATQFIHRRILVHEKWLWYKDDVLIPLIAAVVMSYCFKTVWGEESGFYNQLTLLILASITTFCTAIFFAPKIRYHLIYKIKELKR